jgi:predicted nucleic acid-binding Zn ribbon protein
MRLPEQPTDDDEECPQHMDVVSLENVIAKEDCEKKSAPMKRKTKNASTVVILSEMTMLIATPNSKM